MTNEYCIRCTHQFRGEIKYFLLGGYYCESCMITIENDPSFPVNVKHLQALASLNQIES